jgi:hypothetical protein
VRKNYDQIERWSAEKLALARKVYAYVEANLGKINNKMRQIEESMGEENMQAYGIHKRGDNDDSEYAWKGGNLSQKQSFSSKST